MGQKIYFFSIIIPTFNRPASLAACLKSLTLLNYPQDRFEVIVVDDGSEKPLNNVVASFQKKINIILLQEPNRGPASARNTGALRANGKFLVFTDDDCCPASDWLTILERHFNKVRDRVVGGRTINSFPHNIFSSMSQMIIDAVYDYYNKNRENSQFFAANNFAISKAIFKKIGGFNDIFLTAEDRELCYRILHYGYLMTYAPDVIVFHGNPLNFIKFVRQHFNYGRGGYLFHKMRAMQKNTKQISLEPALFYIHLIQYPFKKREKGIHSLLVEALLVLSQAASTVGFLWERRKQMK